MGELNEKDTCTLLNEFSKENTKEIERIKEVKTVKIDLDHLEEYIENIHENISGFRKFECHIINGIKFLNVNVNFTETLTTAILNLFTIKSDTDISISYGGVGSGDKGVADILPVSKMLRYRNLRDSTTAIDLTYIYI